LRLLVHQQGIEREQREAMMDIRTSYLGMRLEHPFIAGASPFGYHVDTVKRLEDAGCAAVVLHSLFEEQITRAYYGRVAAIDVGGSEFADVMEAFPNPDDYPQGPDEYAEHIYRTKRAVSIPIVGSLNGRTAESWLRFARVIEQAGADALELNMYEVPTQFTASGTAIEDRIAETVKNLKRLLKIPIAVKLSPFFTALGSLAARLDAAGADGLVLFNRFYQPDIDIKTIKVVPQAGLSTNAELPLRLHWVAALHGRVRPSLAISGGVAQPEDGIKGVLAGADVIQLVSALLNHGPGHVAAMRKGLTDWLEWHKMEDLGQARGLLSLKTTRDTASYERAQYIRTLHTWQV
jgi:dihydroorotate dehydrogenase (fumarate)